MDLETWLAEHNYRESTIAVTRQQYHRIQAAFVEQDDLPEYTQNTARRVLTYLQETSTDEQLRRYLVEQGVTPAKAKLSAKPKQRKYEARSFDLTDFDAFQDALYRSDDPRDRVIEVLCVSGARIGDVLRTRRNAIAQGLETGTLQMIRKGGAVVPMAIGVPQSWQRLYDQMELTDAPKVAALLSPLHPSEIAGRGPYMQIDRRLKYWQRELGIKGRVHTHKMRRTFAVRLLGLTKDITLVKQSLNHGDLNSTMKYLDEIRTEEVAVLQRQLRGARS